MHNSLCVSLTISIFICHGRECLDLGISGGGLLSVLLELQLLCKLGVSSCLKHTHYFHVKRITESLQF